MAKGRIINKCIWKSEKLLDLNARQRLLWIGLITTADDQGRGRAHPGLVRSTVFPLEDIEWDVIATSMQLFVEMGMIILYEAEGKQLYQIVNWWDEQYQGGMKWAWPSQYNPPPGWQDRVRHREGNAVVETGWDQPGGLMDSKRSHGEPTTRPSRAHSEPSPSSAPNGNMNGNGNENTNGSSSSAGAEDDDNAFSLYEQAGGILNSLTAEQLGDLIDEYEEHRQSLPPPSKGAQTTGDEWVQAAIQEAVGAGARISVNYIKAILDRWKREGFREKRGDNGKNQRDSRARGGRRYTADDIPEYTEEDLADFNEEERRWILTGEGEPPDDE